MNGRVQREGKGPRSQAWASPDPTLKLVRKEEMARDGVEGLYSRVCNRNYQTEELSVLA